jgi:hypothetical protein
MDEVPHFGAPGRMKSGKARAGAVASRHAL